MPTASDRDRNALPVVPAGRPATVWPCPPTSPGQSSAGWLQSAVERLVATSTRPEDPVLLLTEPAPTRLASPSGTGDDETSEELAESARTVARLGRRVQVRTTPADTPLPQAGSGSGPGPVGPGPLLDRHTLVVTVVIPTRLDWFTHIAWDRLLSPTSMLAVVSHSDSRGGWLIDPTTEVHAAAARNGLALLDRIVLLEVPLHQLSRPAAPIPTGTLAHRVHSDLLLFTPISSGPRPGWSQHR